MIKSLPVLALLISMCAYGQIAYRVDPIPAFTTSTNTPPGAYPPVLAIPGATVNVCGDLSCATSATTYTDSTALTTCPSNAPAVPAGTTLCVATTDKQGNFGFWLKPGTYAYKLLTSGQIFGPFPLTVGQIGNTSYISPQSFGAVGDGAHDDTAGVQAAINTCGPVFFPTGTYKITAEITAGCSNQTVTFSAGALISKTGAFDAWQITGNSNIYTGFTENGNSHPASGLGVFAFFNQITGGSIFGNGGHGIYFDGQPGLGHSCGSNYLTALYSHDNLGIGISENDCQQNRIIGNYTYHNGLEGITIDNQSHYAVVSGNRIDANCTVGASAGIGTDFSNYLSITGNTITNSANGCGGIRSNNALGSSIGLSVTGNTIYNNNGWGITFATDGAFTTTYSTASGNTLNNNTLGPYSSDLNSNQNDFTGNTWNSGNPGGPAVSGFNVINGNILSFFSGSQQNTLDNVGRLQMSGAYADQSSVNVVLTTGFSYTVDPRVMNLIIDPAADLASGSLTMPATPVNGQLFTVTATRNITALTLVSGGPIIKGVNPIQLISNDGVSYIYRSNVNTWFKLAPEEGFTGNKTAGTCALTIVNGLITAVSGC